jgi:alkylresorcinol/alkylpyrone synthase
VEAPATKFWGLPWIEVLERSPSEGPGANVSDAFLAGAVNPVARDLRPVIASTATAVPEHVISRQLVEAQIGRVFSLSGRRLGAVLEIVANSRIERRYSIFPIEYLIEPRSLEQTSREYRDYSLCLGRRAAQQALDRARISPQEVDAILTVSCTGFMIPSLDAYLAPELGLRPNVRRLPVTELGCAAGAAGLAMARDYIAAHPGATVLLVSVELPTLTFQRKDLSQANLVSVILFGDGAAAAVLTGQSRGGPRVVDSESYLFPDSREAMGFDLRDSGFHIVLSKEVPQMIRERIAGLVDGFLARHSLARGDLQAYILHPGGQKLLRFMEEELGLPRNLTQPSWDVLRDFGNLSSASVLFVLHEWLRRGMQPGDLGLLAGFGPGFSSEMLLLQWN